MRRELCHVRVLEERRARQPSEHLVIRLLGDAFHLFDRRVHQVVRVRANLAKRSKTRRFEVIHAHESMIFIDFHRF